MTFDRCQLSTSLNKKAIDDTLKINKRLNKAKNENVLIRLGFPGLIESFKNVDHNNAPLRNLPDIGLKGGFIICLVHEDKDSTPIMWKLTKIRKTAKIAIAAKTLIEVESEEVYFWLAHIPSEILHGKRSDEH